MVKQSKFSKQEDLEAFIKAYLHMSDAHYCQVLASLSAHERSNLAASITANMKRIIDKRRK